MNKKDLSKLKDYIEQLLENIADECNVKEVILKHQSVTSMYSFDTLKGKSIGLDGRWPLWSIFFSGDIRKDMEKVWEIINSCLRQRNIAKIKVRQPLKSITVTI